ncbi:isocitrate lyase/PEP mutase family protein [Streptomyces hainanensis]|uniref:Isocitrate lyase/phosphoenolpyruvate mutase family protein n=1 Tax=Streptomyces hainanensis TaxID=402648 RepID=A0A4R4T8H2_9ACTN|nr:isocitrate lyase/phosphoenolpyruvate mutase family protein [Streptomyces hainanensis]TDC72276.1 isocitrate lyase/phosphoenolpyruvate mutase family protein [Streptomyces hainanensis]
MNDRNDLAARARLLHDLHRREEPLVLPNAWDVASARLVAGAGARAVATTSSGVAWSLGAPDGDRLDRRLAVELVARIAAAVTVPVTADIEAGFAVDAAGVGETVRLVIEAGAAGVNIEDTDHRGPGPLRPVAEQAARLAAAHAAGESAGVPVFVNARVDVFLGGAAGRPHAESLRETLDRGRAYLDAGADGIFVPGVTDPETVAALAEGLAAPLNVMTGPGAPPVAELAAAGAARISVGAGLAQAAYALVERAAGELLRTGTYTGLDSGDWSFGRLNALLEN